MSTASFSVNSKLDGAGGNKPGTMTIDRATGEVRVRPKGSRQVYLSNVNELATLVCVMDLKRAVREAG
jgi:hypothetical protein